MPSRDRNCYLRLKCGTNATPIGKFGARNVLDEESGS